MPRHRKLICAPVAILLIVLLIGSFLMAGNVLLHDWMHQHDDEADQQTHQCAATFFSQQQLLPADSAAEKPPVRSGLVLHSWAGRILPPVLIDRRLDFSRAPPVPVVFSLCVG